MRGSLTRVSFLLLALIDVASAAESNRIGDLWGHSVQWFFRGGPVMYPILACSIVGLAVFPLQLLALLVRGLIYEYLGITALGAYVTLYTGHAVRRTGAADKRPWSSVRGAARWQGDPMAPAVKESAIKALKR